MVYNLPLYIVYELCIYLTSLAPQASRRAKLRCHGSDVMTVYVCVCMMYALCICTCIFIYVSDMCIGIYAIMDVWGRRKRARG